MSIKKYLICWLFLPLMIGGTSSSFGTPNSQLSDIENIKNGYIILAKNEGGEKKPKKPKKPDPNECPKPQGGMCPRQPIEGGKCPAGCNKVNATECSCRSEPSPGGGRTSPPTTQTPGGSYN